MNALNLLFAAIAAICCSLVAEAAEPITYLDWDQVQKQMTNATATSYVVVTADIETFEAGTTYVVNDWVTAKNHIVVKGTEEQPTSLILADDGWLTANHGIGVAKGRKLVICAPTGGEDDEFPPIRQLSADCTEEGLAGIGGDWTDADCGTIVINGGSVSASGGDQAAGIGGGNNGAGGNVTVNGGLVNVNLLQGGANGAGIGGGNNGVGGTVTINGGNVSANGGQNGAGIGGGNNGAGASMTMNGGMITANGAYGVAGIGAGVSESPIDPGTVTFGPGMSYWILAGSDWSDLVEVSEKAFVSDHSATLVMIDSWPGHDGPLTIQSGRYSRLNLVDELGIVIPDDVDYAKGDKVTVKVEGLAKGLKIVTTQLKETTVKKAVTNVVYTIEGVPTEAVDFNVRPMYVRVRPSGRQGVWRSRRSRSPRRAR